MKKFLIATAALMAGTAALAQTQPVAPAPPAPLAPMQHPMHDRVMTRTEVVTMVRDHFGRLDTDKNGSITTQEAMSVHERMGDRMKMRRFDHGEGGERVMRYERRDPKEAFDRLDANKDGVISRDEFGKGQQERFEKRVEIREKVSKARKDGKLNPINSDFDLYSIGEDGKTTTPLRAPQSRDDVIRARDGAFLGLAAEF